jgi:hypothetical protein
MFIDVTPDKTESSPDPNQDWDDQLAEMLPPIQLRPLTPGYDFSYYAAAGLLQGALAGCTSLLVNVIGSVLWPAISGSAQHPLRLIQVYLTFPLGESALELSGGTLLALGCLMYLATGMLYGMLFVVVLSYFLPNAGLRARLVSCSILAIAVWLLNFYGVLAWLQPLLLGGRWIVELVPWWVAALTHLLFGWTIALVYPLGTRAESIAESSAAL